uniref:Putative ovule protein n=1 Tax=Solanum chacoense TaxID=4108 RepID=A0A0V0H5X2_SOLCH
MSYKNTQTSRKLPPLLTTLRGSNSLQCRPYREGGRLVIKAVETPQIRTYFHAERSNGRLRLCFLSDEKSVPTTIDEEDGELEPENDVFEQREINDRRRTRRGRGRGRGRGGRRKWHVHEKGHGWE